MYSCVLGLSQKVDKTLAELKGILEREYKLEANLLSLKGMIEVIQTTSIAQ